MRVDDSARRLALILRDLSVKRRKDVEDQVAVDNSKGLSNEDL